MVLGLASKNPTLRSEWLDCCEGQRIGEGQRRGQEADHVGTGGHGRDFGLPWEWNGESQVHEIVITVSSKLWHYGKFRDEQGFTSVLIPRPGRAPGARPTFTTGSR